MKHPGRAKRPCPAARSDSALRLARILPCGRSETSFLSMAASRSPAVLPATASRSYRGIPCSVGFTGEGITAIHLIHCYRFLYI